MKHTHITIIWAAFILTRPVYWIVSRFIPAETAHNNAAILPILTIVMVSMALLQVIAGVFIARSAFRSGSWLNRQLEKAEGRKRETLAQQSGIYIIGAALTENMAVFGLVLLIMGADQSLFIAMLASSVVGWFLCRPTWGGSEKIIGRTDGPDTPQ